MSLAGDPNLSYFVIGPVAKKIPPDGFGLIVVLPGGDNKADSLAYYIEHSPQDKIGPSNGWKRTRSCEHRAAISDAN